MESRFVRKKSKVGLVKVLEMLFLRNVDRPILAMGLLRDLRLEKKLEEKLEVEELRKCRNVFESLMRPTGVCS